MNPPCRTNEAGEFWVSEEARRSTARTTMVSFAYQVQGSIDLNVELLRSVVLPALERQLAAALVPELFAPHACALTAEQQVAQQRNGLPPPSAAGSFVATYAFEPMDDTNNHHRRRLTSLANGPADAPVTGMQPIPDDVLLPNYEGGACVVLCWFMLRMLWWRM